MFCIVKFRVLVLDSLMYSHLSIGLLNQSLVGTLLLTDTIIFFFFFWLFYFVYAENRHYRLICITRSTDVTGWPEQIKIKNTYNLGGQF